MTLHRLLPVALLGGLLVTTGCEELLNNELEELMGLSCQDGPDPALVGPWTASSMDWGEGDMVAQGWDLKIELFDDHDGRLVETKPGDETEAATIVTDSAWVRWVGCDGQLAIVIQETWIESSSGEFNDVLFEYGQTDGGMTLTGGGMTIVLGSGTTPTDELALDPDLIGVWTATSKVVTSEDGSQQVDLIVDEGHSMVVSFHEGGTYDETYEEPTGPESYDGYWTAEGGVLQLMESPNGEPVQTLTYSIAGDEASVHDSEGETYDFDGDGTEVPVTIDYTFVR